MKRSYVLSAASAIALATGLANSPAMAFDKVWWDWYLDVDTKVDVKVDVDIKVDPSGAVISETVQVFHGNLDADAVVKGVYNDPPHGSYWHPVVLDGAADLPEVSNVAAALGNSNSIQSEVSVQSDVYQSTDGGSTCWGYFCYSSPADLSANAQVSWVTNASVSNTAQAIGNSNSITVDPATPDDALVISNVEQSAYLNASAYASVSHVYVSGYDDLGTGDFDLNRPLVSNAAIAAGNINTITVVVGSIPTPDDVD